MQSKNIGLGQFIQPGEKLARIYSTDAAEIRLPLTAGQLGFLDLPLGARNDAGPWYCARPSTERDCA